MVRILEAERECARASRDLVEFEHRAQRRMRSFRLDKQPIPHLRLRGRREWLFCAHLCCAAMGHEPIFSHSSGGHPVAGGRNLWLLAEPGKTRRLKGVPAVLNAVS